MTKPLIHLDVIAWVPEGWGLCQPCEVLMSCAGLGEAPSERGMNEAPPEMQMEYRRLSALLLDLSARYADQLLIRIYDPYSLRGLVKSLRHGVRRYPTFVVDRKEKIAGWETQKLEAVLRRLIRPVFPLAQSDA